MVESVGCLLGYVKLIQRLANTAVIKMKYAIKIPFTDITDESTWLFVTDSSREDFNDVHVKVFKTKESAEKAAKAWRVHKVVEYDDE